MIADYLAFIDHKRELTVSLINGSSRKFTVALNLKTGLYFRIIAALNEFEVVTDEESRLNIIVLTTTEILKSCDKRITVEWISNNISIENQLDIITKIMNEINTLLKNDCFNVPDINIPEKASTKTDADKDRKKTKDSIKRLNRLLAGKLDDNIIDDVTIIMSKTANSYSDIMNMPILIFRDTLKTVILNELRSDDDYNLEYLRYKANELQLAINNGKDIDKPAAPKKGADLAKLKKLISM